MTKPPLNPFLASLFAIAALALVVGVIVLLVGYRLSESFDATNEDPTAGLAQLAVGSQLASLGFIALIVALGAAAVTWRPVAAVKPDPSLRDSL
jgi:hypothetical protein